MYGLNCNGRATARSPTSEGMSDADAGSARASRLERALVSCSPRAVDRRAAAGYARFVGETRWQIATHVVPPPLRPFVRACVGFHEDAEGPVLRRELPSAWPVVILELGAPLVLSDLRAHRRPRTHRRGFVAGIDDGFTFTAHAGMQTGIELRLTHTGARALFGVPGHALAGAIVDLDDALPRSLRDLGPQLAALPTWSSRFAWLDDALLRHLRPQPMPEVAWAVARIVQSDGAVGVAELVDGLGWSHRRTIAAFREHVGVPPKQLARIVRFEAVLAALRAADASVGWAALAARVGFADQAHLAREVRRMTGLTPTGLVDLVAGHPGPHDAWA